jgi:hypothetical protein
MIESDRQVSEAADRRASQRCRFLIRRQKRDVVERGARRTRRAIYGKRKYTGTHRVVGVNCKG